jgi:predicted Zn-dependent protease
MAEILTESEARALCERILSRSTAEGTEVRLQSGVDGNTRFAVNQLTTGGEVVDAEATVTARVGQRSAAVSFNSLEDYGIDAAVRKAESLARLAPEDPEQMPQLGEQQYVQPAAFFESTEGLGPEQRADAVAEAVAYPREFELVATGFLARTARSTAVANSAGLFGYSQSTLASVTTTVRTPEGDGSGWAGSTHNDWSRVTSPAELVQRAADKSERSVDATVAQPGPYTVVLEPTAVGSLVRLLAFGLGARSNDEGRGAFSRAGGGNRVGERVMDERITIVSDPEDPDLLEQPFTDEGLPVGRTTWIENGVLANLSYDRYWAEYIRGVDPRTLKYTGLTRDGTFLIENGRVTAAVKNLRFNESVLAMLNNVEAMGEAERVVASESGGLGPAVVVPPLVVRDFHFTSISDAV